MKDKDQILLESIYDQICEAAVTMENPQSLIGKMVEVHPAIKGTPTSDPLFMGWSIKVKTPERPNGQVLHTARTLYLKDCYAELNHEKINKKIRNPEMGQKSPIILLKGTIAQIDFPIEELKKFLAQGDWKSATYNPHKHTEYVYKDKLPDWWDTDERFAHVQTGGDFVKNRAQAMIEKEKEQFEYNNLSKKETPEDTISKFRTKEILLKQYLNRGEDYMWVKGVL